MPSVDHPHHLASSLCILLSLSLLAHICPSFNLAFSLRFCTRLIATPRVCASLFSLYARSSSSIFHQIKASTIDLCHRQCGVDFSFIRPQVITMRKKIL
uniref:Putative secreted protein n=1 Tax=Lutzomyia longipalpis TaxID=7200 RepID=A0A7G3ANF4_LUTLO